MPTSKLSRNRNAGKPPARKATRQRIKSSAALEKRLLALEDGMRMLIAAARQSQSGPTVDQTSADAASTSGPRTTKVRQIGNSFGVVLPRDILDRINVVEGDTLVARITSTGVELVPAAAAHADPDWWIDRGAEKYRKTLHVLSK